MTNLNQAELIAVTNALKAAEIRYTTSPMQRIEGDHTVMEYAVWAYHGLRGDTTGACRQIHSPADVEGLAASLAAESRPRVEAARRQADVDCELENE